MMFRRLVAAMTATALISAGLAAVAAASAAPAGATTFPDFTICPAVGADTGGCGIVIVINPDGGPSIYTNPGPNSGPFDGEEDELVGVQNNSGQTIASLPMSGEDIFGFDGDGLCTFITCDYPDPTTYEGPNTSFTVVDNDNGAVNFTGGLADQGSAYFSLEGAVTSSSLIVEPPIQAQGVTSTTTVGFTGPVATFTQASPDATPQDFTAIIDWGDGTATSPGTISGTAPNFTVSGTHTFASTGTKTVTVTITSADNASNQAVALSTFTVNPACVNGQVCTETATVPGVQTSQVITSTGGTVSESIGQDASFGCGDTFMHAPLVVTITGSSNSQIPKAVLATIDKSVVGSNKPASFHICYGGGVAFTDLNGHAVPAGGSGLLPNCKVTKQTVPLPCELPSVKLPNGNVVESFFAPGSDPKYH